MPSLACLVIGDPHFKVNDMVASVAMADAIIEVAKQRKPQFIVCLGDTLDRHETIHVKPLVAATDWLIKLGKIADVYLLIGNHDRPNNSDFLSDDHPFYALKHINPDNTNVCVIDKAEIISIPIYGTGIRHNFFFVPYVPPGRFEEALKTNKDWDPKANWTAGFTHQEFYGIEMAKGIFSDKGDQWPVDGPLIINGHIHDRSVPQPNIISIGTPRQHDFDESPDKAISLFTFEYDDNGKSTYEEQRIPLPLPKKIIIKLTVSEFLDYQQPSPLNDYIKIEIHGNKAELMSLRKVDKIKKIRALGIKIVTRDTEAGQKRNLPTPLPASTWQKTSFRDRLSYRAQEDLEVQKVYYKIFPKIKLRKITIKTKNTNISQ